MNRTRSLAKLVRRAATTASAAACAGSWPVIAATNTSRSIV